MEEFLDNVLLGKGTDWMSIDRVEIEVMPMTNGDFQWTDDGSLVVDSKFAKSLVTRLYPLLRQGSYLDINEFELLSRAILLFHGDCPWLWLKRQRLLSWTSSEILKKREIQLCKLALHNAPKAGCIYNYLFQLTISDPENLAQGILAWMGRKRDWTKRLYGFWTFRTRLMSWIVKHDLFPLLWKNEWESTLKLWDSDPCNYSVISYRAFLVSLMAVRSDAAEISWEISRVKSWIDFMGQRSKLTLEPYYKYLKSKTE